MKIYIKNTNVDSIVKELDLENALKNLIVRRSRAKRSFARLIENCKNDDKYALARLKTYYKLYLWDKASKKIKSRFGNLIILPYMIDKEIELYNGKGYSKIRIRDSMCGRFLGEFITTRKIGSHSARGISTDKIKR